ncbi:MAG: molybdopterin-binding protein [Anaerolineaceae bacterium]|nr:molybdopterin-binding protein [Anaerolineaceae bacterium]
MATAEIVTIGTELLLGEINDTNSRYIARALRDIGVDIYRITSVGDNAARITATLQEALMRSDFVITTGGLGPTVDDPTRKAVADVFNVPLEYIPELWQEILERFARYTRTPTENNKRQAFVPAGSLVISNPVGTAPAFAFELGTKTTISLPGVPKEMEYLLQNFVLAYLKKRYKLQESVIKAIVVHTVGKGESAIDELVGELETLNNPTVGLLAHPGQTDIRITAKASSLAEAERMIKPVLETVREKLKPFIYGEDETTLEEVVAKALLDDGKRLAVIEYGTHGEIVSRLHPFAPHLTFGQTLEMEPSNESLKTLMKDISTQKMADMILGVRVQESESKSVVLLSLQQGEKTEEVERSYGGPKGDARLWAINSAFDLLRQKLYKLNE